MDPYRKVNTTQMEVIKRNGKNQRVSFDKVTNRIRALCWGLSTLIDPIEIAKQTINGIYNKITTKEIDTLSADICASRIIIHPDYNKLAARICVSNLHKNTEKKFSAVIQLMYDNLDIHGQKSPLISHEVYDIVMKNEEKIQAEIINKRDYDFSFFGIKTLERSYLTKLKNTYTKDNKDNKDNKETEQEKYIKVKYGRIIERPQHMWMRVSLGIHSTDLDAAFETYHMMSQMMFTHATPTLFNSGTPKQQFASCFLASIDDSIDSIFKTAWDCAKISKYSGGIGIHVSSVRSNGSLIRGTNGTSNGIVPMIKLFNQLANYIDQGGKRNGSIAVYLEPWHPDIYNFCVLRKKTGDEKLRARDIFLALWVPDLFMKRVRDDKMWSLMCPDECPNLNTTHGKAFEKLYLKYEKEGKFRKQVKATHLWYHILQSQLETGMPYMAYKDNVNNKSNQMNLGTIRSSNLCCEIMEYSDQNETATCNLMSICLPKFLEESPNGELTYNFNKLVEVAKIGTRNLNKVIDRNFYPTSETKKSNFKHRPLGIGVQGLADVYNRMKMPFGSDEAKIMNKKIFETIYYGSLVASNELAIKDGPYESFPGSPFSKGVLQYHLWGLNDEDLLMGYDWKTLKESIMKHGTRNSLLTALMPTASTSQIMNNNECFEPYTTNLYTRSTLAGEYIVLNENLVRDLIKLDLWNENMRKEILYDNGSVQHIKEIPDKLKQVYLTAFETKQKDIIQQSIERGAFIDQSQSMNLFIARPNTDILTSCHMYGWKNGIKTGMYYLRGRPAADPIKFGLDIDEINKIKVKRSNIDIVHDDNDATSDDNYRSDNYKDCEECGS
jgi:ribonucleoside-diphosphate reductase alpha chain